MLQRKLHSLPESNFSNQSPYSFLLEPPTVFSAKPGDKVLLECPGIANPVPKATWSRPVKNFDLNNGRFAVLGYGLQITDVQLDDEGTYICRLDNGENPVKVHTMKLNVLQMPDIVEAPRTSLTNESDRLELHCRASGSPAPEIYWMINGEDTRFDSLISSQGSRLVIRSVEKRHAGIVQCFARNEVGEVNEGAMLQVNPKQIDGEGKPIPLGIPQKSRSRNNNRASNGERRKNKGRKLKWNFIQVSRDRHPVTRIFCICRSRSSRFGGNLSRRGGPLSMPVQIT